MSDADHISDEQPVENQPNELDLLKKQADRLGVKYHPTVGVEKLRERVAAALSDEPIPNDEPAAEAPKQAPKETPAMARARMRRESRQEALRLVRLRITNLNPHKKDLHGEIFTVANKIVGDVKKFIPYGETTEDGYHVPNFIYKQLKARRFLQIKTRKDPKKPGNTIVDQRWVPEFALEVLDPLTPEELKDLAAAQAAAGGVE